MTMVESILPIALIIFAGWALKAGRIIPETDWSALERICYLVFFPAIIVHTLMMADLRDAPVVALGGTLIGAILTMTTLLLAGRHLLGMVRPVDDRAFTSVLQGSIRWNTFVGLGLAQSLLGAPGVTLMSISVAAMVPLLNVISVLVLTRYNSAAGAQIGPLALVRTMITNPFIWSCLLGIALNWLAIPIPASVSTFTSIIGAAALGGGLLVVGAALDLRRLARPRLPHLIPFVLKLAVMPIFAAAFAMAFGLTGTALVVAIVAASMPTASASYIMAKRFNGDAPLMAEILTLQTIAALITIPVSVALLA